MSKKIVFQERGWEDYQHWIHADRKILKKINDLIRDIERGANDGIGKPEPLKNELSGYWSRRITDVHRLIYNIDEENIYIVKCKGHYGDK
jgi:toxin YoeB